MLKYNIRFKLLAIVVALLVLFVLPHGISGYWIRVLTSLFMYATLAQATNIITGFGGYPALGNVVFFGMGAYGVAYLMIVQKLGFYISLIIGGGLMPFMFALIFGLPVMRTKGHYFVMATIALAEGMRELFSNLEFIGGGRGLTLPLLSVGPELVGRFFYNHMLILFLICTLTVWYISKNRLGFALRCIKANEEAAGAMAINTSFYKVFGWAISAFFMGIAGGLFAYWNGFINPHMVFNILISLKFFAMMLLGGMGTIFGPILGATIVELTSELVWGSLLEFHFGVLGGIFVIVALFIPKGLIWLFDSKIDAFKHNLSKSQAGQKLTKVLGYFLGGIR